MLERCVTNVSKLLRNLMTGYGTGCPSSNIVMIAECANCQEGKLLFETIAVTHP